MLYFALVFFLLAVAAAGLDLANLEFAHGGGPAANVLLVLALAFLVAKVVMNQRHGAPRRSG
jgi:hypothetical protein